MKKLVIIQTVAPDYRKAFFNEIRHRLNDDFELYSGESYFEKSVVTDKSMALRSCKNHYFARRQVLFQTGIWHLLFLKAVLVLEMNPRIVSNWIFLIVRRVLGRKTVLWGHAWPRKGAQSSSDRLRHLMRMLGNVIITYTKNQKKELHQKMPNKKIIAAPNALYTSSSMCGIREAAVPKNMIYVGRLTLQKKPFFLVRAFIEALPYLPLDMNLIIVGDGDEKQKIQDFIADNKVKDRVILKGHLSAINDLYDLYSSSLLSVSPGYVGLSVTQSFGFGVPMLVSRNEKHSPEIEAIEEGKNAVFFETDSVLSFRESVVQIVNNKALWIAHRKGIQENCKANYSVEAMAKVFINLVQGDA